MLGGKELCGVSTQKARMTDKTTKKQLPGILGFFIKLLQIILYIYR